MLFQRIVTLFVLLFIVSWLLQCGASFECNNKQISVFSFSSHPVFVRIRESSRTKALEYLPSPHSELLLGVTLGQDELNKVPRFKALLKQTGTIHVVVVSGYNISLVFNMLYAFIGKPYTKPKLFMGVFVTLVFSFLSGFEPPIIRAWLMGVLLVISKYYGRRVPILNVLVISSLSMMIISPSLLQNLSFQLSFLATLSLIVFGEYFSNLLDKTYVAKLPIKEDFASTLAAQVLVWPVISYYFGTVSVLSPLINALVLWTVPLSTIWGSVFLFVSHISTGLARLVAYIVYVPLDIFIVLVGVVSIFEWASVGLQLSFTHLLVYYFLLICVCLYRYKSLNTTNV